MTMRINYFAQLWIVKNGFNTGIYTHGKLNNSLSHISVEDSWTTQRTYVTKCDCNLCLLTWNTVQIYLQIWKKCKQLVINKKTMESIRCQQADMSV